MGGRGATATAGVKLLFLQRRGKTWRKRRGNQKKVAKIMRLKAEMKEISEEQRSIKEQQRQVKEKFQAVESECKKLGQEAILVMQQCGCTKLRLALMFQILKARENNDFAKAAHLTHALRELMAQQNYNQASVGTSDK
ncbi:hypothetical protein V6N13_148542 [Hibiscus sabdariffa]|uniref:Uncharacterized protein n=1 Tax=Hibiscus sabdariffa TaxID=183260 RepID=A0ABR2TZC6_9ROSI